MNQEGDKSSRTVCLGINSVYHESAAAVVIDGKLVAAAEEERFNRCKHGKKASIPNTVVLPFAAIEWCLNEASVSIDDVSYIGYSFDPYVRFDLNAPLETTYKLIEGTYGSASGEKHFLQMNTLAQHILEQWFETSLDGRFHFIPHHLAHLASAYYPSPWPDAAVLCVDGIGEFATSTIAHGNNGDLEILDETSWPHSIGFLWEKITGFLGFRRNNDECKVMGLASYGDPSVYRDTFGTFVSFTDGWRFTVNDAITRFRNEEDYSGLEPLLGHRRTAGSPLHYEGENKRHANIAATLQEITDKAILGLAEHAQNLTKSKHLCIAGGVGLNCVTNGYLAKNTDFSDIWVQPAANDAGTAAGCAYHLHHVKTKSPHRETPVSFNPYLGPAYSVDNCLTAIKRHNLSSGIVDYPAGTLEEKVAKILSEDKIVGWFQGRMEWGPRALGNRSILANPKGSHIKDLINQRVKHRENFRPFCPSVLQEKADQWFDFYGKEPVSAADYMLVAYDVREDKKDLIPAVVHIDNTARVQIVRRESCPRYHRLISCFASLTDIPLLLNTSFNDQEPIVCSPDDAIKCFKKTEIDYLVLGDILIDRKRCSLD